METHNTDRAKPYVFFYRLSKLAGRYNHDLTKYEKEKCKEETIGFDGDDCFMNALDFCLKLKGEEREDAKNKFFEYNLQLHAHNGSGFDTWIVLNNLPCDERTVIIIKNGKGIIELKIFNVYIGNKQIPQYLHFRCGIIHLCYSLKKSGESFILQKRNIKN